MSLYDYQGNVIAVSGAGAFVNVTDYGAVGNGVTDDTIAIQNAINAINNGGIVFFPKGTYLVTASIYFYSNNTLWFESGASLLQGAAINNILMTYCASDVGEYNGTHDCVIYGGTFDGGAFTTNNTLVGTVHAKNITFANCTFRNAYGIWHNLEINSSYNVKVVSCDFEGRRKTGANGCMIQIDAIDNAGTWPWSNNRGLIDNTISKYIDIDSCIFHDNTVSPAIGNHSSTTDSFITIHDCIFDGLTSTRGSIVFNASNVDIFDNTFNGCTTGVGSSGDTYYIHDNRFVDVTTAVSGNTSVAHANMINGTYTV
jgi:hypothetical protein